MNLSPHTNPTRSDEKSPKFGTHDNFIPLGFSSPISQQKDNSDAYPSQRRNYEVYSANRRGNPRSNQKNRFFSNNRQNYDNRGQNQHQSPHPYQHQQWSARKAPQDFAKNTPHKNKKDNTQFYFHPSMLEDPWKELISEREEQQKINLNSAENEGQSRSPASSSNDECDPPAKKAINSDKEDS